MISFNIPFVYAIGNMRVPLTNIIFMTRNETTMVNELLFTLVRILTCLTYYYESVTKELLTFFWR